VRPHRLVERGFGDAEARAGHLAQRTEARAHVRQRILDLADEVGDGLADLERQHATVPAVSSIRSNSVGAGLGRYFWAGGKLSIGCAVSSTLSRSTLDTPSTMQWWILLIIAKRLPSLRPSTIQISRAASCGRGAGP